MNTNPEPKQPNRMIGVLVFLFVVVFAGLAMMQYQPWKMFGAQGSSHTPDTGDETDPHIIPSDLPVIKLELESGDVLIQLRPDLSPNHVERIIELSESGFYDGVVFHRVIDGFMAQTGDPTGTGMGGSDLPDLAAEFNNLSFERGTVGMARSASFDSANSQFFIVYGDASFLNGQYTLFGKVIEGMEFVDQIRKGNEANNGQVDNPDHVVSMRLQGGP